MNTAPHDFKDVSSKPHGANVVGGIVKEDISLDVIPIKSQLLHECPKTELDVCPSMTPGPEVLCISRQFEDQVVRSSEMHCQGDYARIISALVHVGTKGE